MPNSLETLLNFSTFRYNLLESVTHIELPNAIMGIVIIKFPGFGESYIIVDRNQKTLYELVSQAQANGKVECLGILQIYVF